MPRVTVITATYNWATVLPYSIGSVLDQTFRDFELLVIGDGCSDESEAVVARVGDPRVRWYNLPSNTGHQSGPNNEGIRRAQGDVIAYLGHDDLWLPQHLELLVHALDQGSRLVHATTLLVKPDSPPILRPRQGWVYRPGVWLAPTTAIHDRALIDAVGGWRRPSETGLLEPEAELWQRVAQHCGPPRWVPHLTSIKLPSALRRDVYKIRPSHEQAYWLQRIRSARAPEEALQAACREQYIFGRQNRRQRMWATSRNLLEPVRSKLALQDRLRRRGGILGSVLAPPPPTAMDHWIDRRRFNGLDD